MDQTENSIKCRRTAYFFMIVLMCFFIGLLPYYIQIFANFWFEKKLINIDNFNFYVIGYTLFLVAAPTVLSKIDLKDIYGQWAALGMGGLFVVATVMLFIEHLFMVSSINKLEKINAVSTNVAIGFIIINGLIVTYYAWVRSLELTNNWLKNSRGT